MIIHAVAYADDRISYPPHELQMAQMIKEYGSPWPGGWLEWPAGLASKMTTALAYSQAIRYYRQHAHQKGWVDANQHIFKLVSAVWQWKRDKGLAWG